MRGHGSHSALTCAHIVIRHQEQLGQACDTARDARTSLARRSRLPNPKPWTLSSPMAMPT